MQQYFQIDPEIDGGKYKMKGEVKAAHRAEFQVQDYPMVHIAGIHKAYNVNLTNEFRAFDVTPQMWRILVTLQAKDGYSIGHLSEITLIEQSHLSRMIDSMERDDLLIRKEQMRDKRIKLVHLTRKGRKLFVQLLPIVLDQYDKVLSGFSSDEISTLMEYLGRIRVNMTTHI